MKQHRTKKDRRNSGRKYPRKLFHPSLMHYIQPLWDDWSDFRDSQRGSNSESWKDQTKSKRQYSKLFNKKLYK